MLGLVVGPGVVLGVGLVVLGVSVPVPPILDPEDVPEDEPLEEPPLALPLPESEGMLPVLLPDVPERLPDVPELPLEPVLEPLSFPAPEPPPVMPAHALSNTAQAMGIIHLVIDRSRKDKKAIRIRATYRRTALTCSQ